MTTATPSSAKPVHHCDCGCKIQDGRNIDGTGPCKYRVSACACGDEIPFGEEACFSCRELENNRRYRQHNRLGEYA